MAVFRLGFKLSGHALFCQLALFYRIKFCALFIQSAVLNTLPKPDFVKFLFFHKLLLSQGEISFNNVDVVLNFAPHAFFSVQSQTAWHFAVAVFIPEITAVRL